MLGLRNRVYYLYVRDHYNPIYVTQSRTMDVLPIIASRISGVRIGRDVESIYKYIKIQ